MHPVKLFSLTLQSYILNVFSTIRKLRFFLIKSGWRGHVINIYQDDGRSAARNFFEGGFCYFFWFGSEKVQ